MKTICSQIEKFIHFTLMTKIWQKNNFLAGVTFNDS